MAEPFRCMQCEQIEQQMIPLLQDAIKRSNGSKDLTEDALK